MRPQPTRVDWSAGSPFRFAVGIEDTFIAHEAPGRRKLDEYELTQHYTYWRDDIDLVAASGATALRWGIPWYRIEPEPGRFEWDWVDRVVDHMVSHDITCIVDLMHYGTPLWMPAAFADPDYPKRVANYAAAAAERYGDRLHTWTPLNEPVVNAERCGEQGLWPPYLEGDAGFTSVALALAEGIAETQRAIADVQPDAAFVYVEAGFRYAGTIFPGLSRELLDERRFVVLDLVLGRVDDAHPLRTWLLDNGADPAALERLASSPVVPDVIGVNYYPDFSTAEFDAAGTSQPVATWVEALDEQVRSYHRRYGLPLMITETSRGGDLDGRRRWLADSLDAVAAMRAGGVPLVGYTWFPFIALVDWLYREDTAPIADWIVQMGMVDLHQEPGGGALQRIVTPLLDDFRAASKRGMPPIPPAPAP